MIGISRLYCETPRKPDPLHHDRGASQRSASLLRTSRDAKPVVVWNVGQRCNLKCAHCYSDSRNVEYRGEMSRDEGMALIDDLATFGVPAILFSGGEPLLRQDIVDLMEHAVAKGIRVILSSNGTMITPDMARRLSEVGLSYVGVSVDGLEETHDYLRGIPGAFQRSLQGIRNCRDAGIKVGLRLTLTRHNVKNLPAIFDLIDTERIPRACFYHLVPTGRGSILMDGGLPHHQTRRAVDQIMTLTKALHEKGSQVEVLTVNNHADAPYMLMRMQRENPDRVPSVTKLLEWNGGNTSGQGIACISWNGTVHPDQFWRTYACGNVREESFASIWNADTTEPLIRQLRDRKRHLKGRCKDCKWLSICNGNMRVRSELVTGNRWMPDPSCYLTDEETLHAHA